MRIGFSLEDVMRLPVADVVAFADLAAGSSPGAARPATQADIDALYE